MHSTDECFSVSCVMPLIAVAATTRRTRAAHFPKPTLRTLCFVASIALVEQTPIKEREVNAGQPSRLFCIINCPDPGNSRNEPLRDRQCGLFLSFELTSCSAIELVKEVLPQTLARW